MKQGLWSPMRASIESMNSEGFLSPNPLRSNNVLALSVSESPKAEHKNDKRASYLWVRGGEAITGKALVAVCDSRAATTWKYLVSSDDMCFGLCESCQRALVQKVGSLSASALIDITKWNVGGLKLNLKKIQINYHIGVTSVALIQSIRNTGYTFGFSGVIELLRYRKEFLLGTDGFLHRRNSCNPIVCFLLR